MDDISVGAVGAAIIAGLVSLLGLIIGKEQKVSEFRQAWIDDLRKSLVSYLVNINAISDAIRLRKSGKTIDDKELLSNYKSLNEASHSITLRVNSDESPSKSLINSMSEFEIIANNNSSLTPEKIKEIEEGFIKSSKELLKFEWNRVKRGEDIYIWTKRVVYLSIAAMVGVLIFVWNYDEKSKAKDVPAVPHINFTQSFENPSICENQNEAAQKDARRTPTACKKALK
jgi:uncharacterized protein YnzC (UPF0291/DUF896 family)